MRVKSFRVRNYRSVKDSGTCYLSGDNVTILAGKNESGKTAILEALQDFNIDRSIREEAVPLENPEAKPETTIIFELDKREANDIFGMLNVENPCNTETIDIEIVKEYPNGYSLTEECVKSLAIEHNQIREKLEDEIVDIHKAIQDICSKYPAVEGTLPSINLENVKAFGTQIQTFVTQTQPNLATITEQNERNMFSQNLTKLGDKIKEFKDSESVEASFMEEMKPLMPNFILFSAFEDIFPSVIPLGEAPKSELIKDLDIISNLDLKLIQEGTHSRKMRHKKQLNLRIQEEYKRFWTQDFANLYVDWDSENLLFFIEENEYYYPPNMRSKGKQWHLAFYVRVSARSKERVPNIILIDEPGLFLHAKAQEDVLNKLEDASENTQIIFSTHSPYLIKIDRLNRIRLTYRDVKKGTFISNKIHKGADTETLTPIITAIGLDLSKGLDIAKDNNIIVEGITDYYYLTAFQKLLGFNFDAEPHFIPSGGADKFGFLVPLMIGWGLNCCVVLDNDRKGRQVKKRLEKDFRPTDLKIVFTSEEEDEEIEDLFERKDFATHILGIEPSTIPADKRISQVLKQKDKKYDKVLLSKSFFEKTRTGTFSLSSQTKTNFKQLLRRINASMFSNENTLDPTP